jgi:hypothetical protein
MTSLIEQADKLGTTIPKLYTKFQKLILQDALDGKLDLDADEKAFALYMGGENHPLTKGMSYLDRGKALKKMIRERGKVRKLSKAEHKKAIESYNKLYAKAIR